MPTAPQRYLTPEEYLAIERRAEYKSEYHDGEMFAMAGASAAHTLIVSNLVRELGNQLKTKDCLVYATDLRLCVRASGLYTYPDVIVVCGSPKFLDAMNDTLINPTVLIEVLSPTTEVYDRGKKFEMYRDLPSLQEYVLVAQDRPSVEKYLRQADGSWLYSSWSLPGDTITLSSVQCSLPMEEIYAKVQFSEQEDSNIPV